MAEYQSDLQEREDEIPSSLAHSHGHASSHEEEDSLARVSGHFLDRSDTIIYAAVGICFLVAAVMALIYTFWQFGVAVFIDIPTKSLDFQPGEAATAIISMVSGLLLVLIIVEILGTVTHYLKSHTTSLRPFLFIGIISATRSILSVGAKLSVGANADFNHSMIELGVSAAVVLALGVTIRVLGHLNEEKEQK